MAASAPVVMCAGRHKHAGKETSMETSEVVPEQDPAHPPEEILERYAMGKAAEAETEQIEEHILICGQCRDALDESDHWIALMKAAALPAEPAKPAAGPWQRWWQSLPGAKRAVGGGWIAGFRTPAVAGTCAAALAVFFVAPVSRQQQEKGPGAVVAEISLAAMRGNDLRVEVPAGVVLRLRFEESIQREFVGSVTIVTADGSPVWSGVPEKSQAVSSTSGADKIGLGILTPKLQPGEYWVRVFGPGGDQIKEYGLISK